MVEAAKKAWETRRKRQQEGYYDNQTPSRPPLGPPQPITSDKPTEIDYPEDMVLTAGADFLPWVEKYRPISLTGTLGAPIVYLKAYVKTGSFPLAFVFSGDFGNGKTTAAKAFVRDYFVFRNVFQRDATFTDVAHGRKFNPDLEGAWPPVLYVDATITGDIGTIRDKVLAFMRVLSIKGYPKFCVFDEADRLGFSAQGALRSLLEKYPKTRTIYTTNVLEKIDEAIISRASGPTDWSFTLVPNGLLGMVIKTYGSRHETRKTTNGAPP